MCFGSKIGEGTPNYRFWSDKNVSITTTGAAGTKFSAGLEIGAAANLFAYKNISFRWQAEPRDATVTNQGSIQLLADAEHIALSASDTVVILSGSGTLILAGNGGHELGNGTGRVLPTPPSASRLTSSITAPRAFNAGNVSLGATASATPKASLDHLPLLLLDE